MNRLNEHGRGGGGTVCQFHTDHLCLQRLITSLSWGLRSTCISGPGTLDCAAMFDSITAEITTAADKLAHLRRFL
jgi:hypothetical protein